MASILVVSPHPDDETLGCGGTLLKHTAVGNQVYWLIITKMTQEVGYSEDRIRARKEEIESIAKSYKFEKTFMLDFATTTLDTIPLRNIIAEVARVVAEVKPETVYLPNRSDAHSDHRITFAAVFGAIKTFRAPGIKRVLSYEVLSETEFTAPYQSDTFVPNSFSDISSYLEEKIKIMRLYKGELGNPPFPRSEENIRALATLRGAIAGVNHAEAFMMIKEIV
ncbi:GlcNAc-PI de-N-acetylase [Candidatus Uhrbacteria bacterium RIFCSPLOWO2_01_FULL_47_24]|uniref:GlcNAc-PI de-N-acetylase n=1 Tax=Candidatus Uhrbacteria bacterium RIFCSPLOWO2_01_FULL_47_24 TaxID=1802401 RepID=A0A1F7USU4_9BACT|nr:MAG: GlcNAc-PI de-N-acetylase [Candidatus Uhrbacteria bacterium RIFCSPHIGHO2_01_FULL_47_11]OGL67792.1 MAG: GlcNAc-PI de-N-acetylase [Candidatus Uhrbacteria bacterium RIFCSPHIGHO2_02_FULL_46_47]OGL76326.1 MAG: GlcNAc-PI de-N-acetylase [Candidatus Uhrbacteria bacterium RIFCSPHIGHO2_12_FULL_47_11]OGL81362.1 MAG: GlcNAc-PI de-N-acetylase [Candidatus Uhrbacteria bacterium RIFCSPLOWO2_01_FULL_47_24]OGL83796.1 MAG: GlcNAc-PI de-N-acetylase [Candidatus Uhrbacteria bacterium RIFCSPLOWO2_02_FULL_46_25